MTNEQTTISAEQLRAKVLRAKQLAEIFGIGLSSIWRHVKEDPTFPRPIHLTPRCVVFDVAEVDAWFESRKSARTSEAAHD